MFPPTPSGSAEKTQSTLLRHAALPRQDKERTPNPRGVQLGDVTLTQSMRPPALQQVCLRPATQGHAVLCCGQTSGCRYLAINAGPLLPMLHYARGNRDLDTSTTSAVGKASTDSRMHQTRGHVPSCAGDVHVLVATGKRLFVQLCWRSDKAERQCPSQPQGQKDSAHRSHRPCPSACSTSAGDGIDSTAIKRRPSKSGKRPCTSSLASARSCRRL